MNIKFLVPAALVLFAVSASADLIIESKVESPQLNTTMTTKIKGGKVRADLTGPMGAMSSIIDSTTGNSIQLIHAQKMAMKTSAAQMKQAIEMSKKMAGAAGQAPAASTKPQATGQKEKVGDYDCEIYTWKGDGLSCRYWIALKHPQAAQLKDAEKQMKNSAFGSAAGGGPDMTGLPGPALKTETTTGDIKSVSTVLSVKEGNIDASEFEVPKDYQNMEMPALPGAGAPGGK